MCREYSDRDYVVRLSVDLAGLAAAGLVVPKAYGPMAPRFQTLRGGPIRNLSMKKGLSSVCHRGP